MSMKWMVKEAGGAVRVITKSIENSESLQTVAPQGNAAVERLLMQDCNYILSILQSLLPLSVVMAASRGCLAGL